jgi:hypothetical protein
MSLWDPKLAPRAELAACSDRTKALQQRERPRATAYKQPIKWLSTAKLIPFVVAICYYFCALLALYQ